MKSMTGFGRGDADFHGRRIIINISSVNRKQSDFRISLPREIAFLEMDFRKVLAERIGRGAISVSVDLLAPEGDKILDPDMARSYWSQLTQLHNEFDIKEPASLSDLLKAIELGSSSEEFDHEQLKEVTLPALNTALDKLIKMREDEGKALAVDLHKRHAILQEILKKIEELAPEVVKKYREKLLQRLKDADLNIEIEEERILKEILLYTDRSDISEECTRLHSHLEQMDNHFDADGVIGRKLDFLIQEMVREINTIGSKASNSEIAAQVVEFKSELERIREQIQNIE